MSRTLRMYCIPDDQIAEYFTVPDQGAIFVHAHYDFQTNTLAATFEHESYQDTPIGGEIQRMPMPVPERNMAWIARLLGLDETQARDWLIAKVAVFRGVSEADIVL